MTKPSPKVLKKLNYFYKKNRELFITHADKGNVNVILNRSDYNEKMFQLINDNFTYKKINYNPLKLIQKDTYKLLENWRLNKFLGKNVSKKDIPINNTSFPRTYGLSKIHKQNFPLCPVVSLINTPTYCMSKIFAKILILI